MRNPRGADAYRYFGGLAVGRNSIWHYVGSIFDISDRPYFRRGDFYVTHSESHVGGRRNSHAPVEGGVPYSTSQRQRIAHVAGESAIYIDRHTKYAIWGGTKPGSRMDTALLGRPVISVRNSDRPPPNPENVACAGGCAAAARRLGFYYRDRERRLFPPYRSASSRPQSGRERPPPETRSGGRRPIGAGSVLRPGAPIPHFPVACALTGARNGPATLPYRSKSGPTSGRLAPRRAQSARGSPGKPVARGVEKGRPKHMGAGKSMPNPTRSSETNHRPSPTETRNRNASGVTRS